LSVSMTTQVYHERADLLPWLGYDRPSGGRRQFEESICFPFTFSYSSYTDPRGRTWTVDLTALAERFVEEGFDQRRMLKTIMSSAVYASGESH
jgi:hypothetical protein